MKIVKNEVRVVKDAQGEIAWEEIVKHARRQFGKAIGLPSDQISNIGVYAERAPIGFNVKISYSAKAPK